MKHKIIEKKVSPELWNRPIPICPEEIPHLGKEDYEQRLERLWNMPQAKDLETIIVYGDREHYSNIEYFTSYDPRWEESLLLLPKGGKPSILVGNEGIGYVPKVPLDIDVVLYQTLSLMGQPNDKSSALADIFREKISWQGGKVGIIGFKAYDRSKHTLEGIVTDLPYYMVETLCQIVPKDALVNATGLMADCEYGLKHHLSAKEIVIFEAAGTRVSRGILNCLRTMKPGMTEVEAGMQCQFTGSPGNMHPNINFGEKNVALGLNSPTEWTHLEYGSPAGVGYGLRGSLVHKCGMYIRDKADLPEDRAGYVDEFAVPYFENVVSWYEMMKIGTSCGDIYDMVDRELGLEAWGCTLNPGHLTHTDEWTNSPIYRGSNIPVGSGMAFQCDYTVTKKEPFMSAHMEDGLVIADGELRDAVAQLSPSCWERILNRREFIRGELGIKLPEEVLPLSDLSGVFFPYMADTSIVLACE